MGNLHINSHLFLQTAFKYLSLQDIYTGLSKSFVFAIVIVLVGAYQGMKTRAGPWGWENTPRSAWWTSFIMIIFADCIVTGFIIFRICEAPPLPRASRRSMSERKIRYLRAQSGQEL